MSAKQQYKVLGERQIIEYVTYTVEAESKEEAIKLVEQGYVLDNGDHWQREMGFGEMYSVVVE